MQSRTRASKAGVLTAIEQGASRQGAAAAAGVSSSTFYRWLESPRFRNDVAAAEGRFERAMVARIALAAARGSARWAAWMLERRLGHYGWRQVSGLELSGGLALSGSLAMQTRLEALDDVELDAAITRLRLSEARRQNRGALPRLLETSGAPE